MNKKTTKTLKPVLRFKEFTDDWEQRKLGECFSERTERSNTGELISVTINDGIKKFADLNRHDNSSEDKSNYKIVKIGDIAYNSMRMWQGASGYSPYNGILSPAYTVCKPKANMNTHFFSYLFKHSELIHTFKVNSQGLTKDTWNLKFPSFSTIKVPVPQHNEQEKISKVFANIDNLITLQQRKYDQLTTLKKYMLANMFPQEGELTPKIRFSGFTNAWEQHKLGDMLQFSNGFNGNAEIYGKGIPYISVMDILNHDFISYDTIRGKVDLDRKTAAKYTVSFGDVLFQRSSENIEDAGRSNVYIDQRKDATFGGFVIRGKKVGVFNPYFMKYMLDTFYIRKQIMNKAQGAQHINVGQDTLERVEINIPLIKEQNIIGRYLYNLDNLITLQQRKCDSLKQAKKFLLQKMFI